MSSDTPLTAIIVQGTTATGKSALALKLAELNDSEIISADSRQIYKYMDIGTAKPSPQEQEKIKHHLIDIVTPDEFYNAGRFARDAEQIIKDLNHSGIIPVITGGTGFYIKALLEGLAAIPEIPLKNKQAIESEHSSKTNLQLHEYLRTFDPDSAERINHQDRQKLLRAISVYQYTGNPISSYWQREQRRIPINCFKILIERPRQEIYERIDKRVDLMLEMGLLEEVEFLIKKGYQKNDPGMRSVGYQELLPYFLENKDLGICIDLIKQHTRNYAKRQITWLKKYQFDLTLDQTDIKFSQVLKAVRKTLRSI